LTSGPTPSQTVGPYFAIGLPWDRGPHAVTPDTPGAIRITGVVYDGAGEPVPDSMIETWQADLDGKFADLHGYGGRSEVDGFRGFARFGAEDGNGSYEIITLKPGGDAPWIDVSVFARGMLRRVVTRIYFDAADIPQAVPAERAATLLATPVDGGYRFDIHLQGSNETVFFDI
jgi:protocatechuate 3,4-dioxygenase, alpha subunit